MLVVTPTLVLTLLLAISHVKKVIINEIQCSNTSLMYAILHLNSRTLKHEGDFALLKALECYNTDRNSITIINLNCSCNTMHIAIKLLVI